MPNTASWNVSPGRASRVSTTRLGALKPATTWPPDYSERERHLAVDPDLGVIVDDDLEHERRAGGVELADPLGNGDRDPVPVEAHAPVREPAHRVLGREPPPARVVEVACVRARSDVVGAVGDVAGPERVRGAGTGELDEVGLLDTRVGVAPLPADERAARGGLQVDDGVGPAGQQLGRSRHRGRRGRRGGGHAATAEIAAAPIAASSASSSADVAPLTPIAPMTSPSCSIGTPPWSGTARAR